MEEIGSQEFAAEKFSFSVFVRTRTAAVIGDAEGKVWGNDFCKSPHFCDFCGSIDACVRATIEAGLSSHYQWVWSMMGMRPNEKEVER
jgi:hypothetical protein